MRPSWHQRARGVAHRRSDLPPLTEADLNPALVEDLECLVDDSIAYLDWVCAWCVRGCALSNCVFRVSKYGVTSTWRVSGRCVV